MTDSAVPPSAPRPRRWYRGVSAGQWLVLAVASAGWVFDAYVSQIYNLTRDSMLSEILHLPLGAKEIKFWGDVFLGVFLVGGALGGTLFGSLADRIGRRPTMIVTILMYAVFSGLTALAHTGWQVLVLRFLVALGTAGEWAVAASLVSESFPPRARAQAGAFFHATSNVGTWLAALVGLAVGANWRIGYLTGVLPALLVLWIRARAPESRKWQEQQKENRAKRQKGGSLKELLSVKPWSKRAIFGMLLATVGLGTYWALTVGGQDLTQEFLLRHGVPAATAASRAKFCYGFLINAGGFVGSVLFGPIAAWLGRKKAFTFGMLGGAIIVPVTWYLPQAYWQLVLLLPFYGWLTFGFHAGFALYFPEMFPTRLRGTGTGFCFNGGRLLAAVVLTFSGWLKSRPGVELREAAAWLSLIYLLGMVIMIFLPETKQEALVGAEAEELAHL